eukprot:TRINITY_DN3484_c0_g1_i2.p1 TRINITY_DN3484_c0_g1~~TRINITY_DN3484_c0_g1_i2.p1  ORF type:complete len:371 (+),score=63.28 TRINITY_DN3484_c0_g1_i2:51-1163(+)
MDHMDYLVMGMVFAVLTAYSLFGLVVIVRSNSSSLPRTILGLTFASLFCFTWYFLSQPMLVSVSAPPSIQGYTALGFLFLSIQFYGASITQILLAWIKIVVLNFDPSKEAAINRAHKWVVGISVVWITLAIAPYAFAASGMAGDASTTYFVVAISAIGIVPVLLTLGFLIITPRLHSIASSLKNQSKATTFSLQIVRLASAVVVVLDLHVIFAITFAIPNKTPEVTAGVELSFLVVPYGLCSLVLVAFFAPLHKLRRFFQTETKTKKPSSGTVSLPGSPTVSLQATSSGGSTPPDTASAASSSTASSVVIDIDNSPWPDHPSPLQVPPPDSIPELMVTKQSLRSSRRMSIQPRLSMTDLRAAATPGNASH